MTSHSEALGTGSPLAGTSASPEAPGLKKNAISFLSNVVIGVASTAPGYSLAATLGLVTAVVGFKAPAIMIVAFLPMLCIALAYNYLNRADPDCGTTFSWVTKAMGPRSGWMGGWAIIIADVIVMANLSQIAGLYTFQLFGNSNPSTFWVTVIGVAWIVVMTWICWRGIELSARTQQFLLGAEFVTLMLFAIVALIKVYAGSAPPASSHVELGWFSPFHLSTTALIDGVLLAVFIYWGWDSGVAVNEETEDSGNAPGRAAVISTLLLVGIYLLVTTAAISFAGIKTLSDNSDDVFAPIGKAVFGTGLDKLLIIAVLTSASASTQTTILPTARTSLSMARQKAMPAVFGHIHPRFQTPDVSTIVMGVVSIVWYVGLTIVSNNVLSDSISALGLMIAFYYGLTGLACVIYFRRELFKSARNAIYIGLLPLLGFLSLGYLFIKSCIDLGRTSSGSTVILGTGGPLVIGLGGLLLGVIFMLLWNGKASEFFKRKPEVADPRLLTGEAPPPEAVTP
ncbi:MAG: APC family permease [Thermoleophilaceae bacterium]